jgi:hypothetical protein
MTHYQPSQLKFSTMNGSKQTLEGEGSTYLDFDPELHYSLQNTPLKPNLKSTKTTKIFA